MSDTRNKQITKAKAEGEGRGIDGDGDVGAETLGTEPQVLLRLGSAVETSLEHRAVACSQDAVFGFPGTY